MLFMGSIITSCIDNTEPQGVLEVREAYARYLDGLTSAQKANEAIAAADAAFRNAQAAVKLAIARQEEAQAKAQEIANAVAQAKADKDIDYWKQQQELQRLAYEQAVLEAKAALAEAQKNFDDAMRALEIYKLGISSEEQQALEYIKDQYDYWRNALANWLDRYADELDDYYDDVLESILAQDSIEATAEYFQEYLEERIKLMEVEIQTAEWAKDYWKELLDNNVDDFLAEAEAFRNASYDLDAEYQDVLRDSTIFVETYGFARDEAYREADSVYTRAIKEPTEAYDAAVAALKKANPKWASMVAAPADGKDGKKMWTANGGAYSFEKKYALPDHTGMVPDMIQYYIDYYWWADYAENVEFVGGDPLDSILVTIPAAKDSATFATIVDTVWNGNQATAKTLGNPTGLWSAYEDFGRAYLFDLDAKGLEADAEIIKAYADKKKAEYDSLLKILQAAKDGQGTALVNAWADAVAKAAKTIGDKKAEILKMADPNDANYDKKYTYHDPNPSVDFASVGKQGIVLYSGKYGIGPRKVTVSTSDPTEFTMTNDEASYFDPAAVNGQTIAPTKADSTKVFNAIVDYFKAVASVDEKAVPYLKFITSHDGGTTFVVDSVRADKMEFSGLQVKNTSGAIKAANILKVSLYDNKGMAKDDLDPTIAKFYDAFTNVLDLFFHYVKGTALTDKLYSANDDAYSDATSGIAAYAKYVADFKKYNSSVDFDGFHKEFTNTDETIDYTVNDFKKYTAASEAGKAVANWMDACEKYFGVEGFAGFGEKVFFDLNTFTDPTNVVVFNKEYLPKEGTKNAKTGALESIVRGVVATPWSSQYGFVTERLWDNMEPYTTTNYGTWEYISYDAANDMEKYSIVFEVLNANFLYELATNTSSLNEIWTELGEVLKQIKADMDAVDGKAKATKAANQALADKFNEALKAYRAATGDAAKARKAAEDAADAEYEKAYKEIYLPILERKHELEILMDYYWDMAQALMGVHAKFFSQPANPVAVREFLMDMYTQANNRLIRLTAALAEFKHILEGIDDPELDWIAEEYDAVQAMLYQLEWEDFDDIQYWYEYWKAAFEAAMELIDANKAF